MIKVVEIRLFYAKIGLYFFYSFGYNVFIQRENLIKQIITVRHKRFATGLFWQPLSVGSTPLNYAKQLSQNKKYTLYVDYRSMIGLGDKSTGIYSGLTSAAAEIVDSLSEFISFLGVFQATNGYYLVAVRNGVIIRDVLFESADQARKAYTELSNIPDWGALFAPSAWGMPRSQEMSLYDLIRSNTSAKLHQIHVFRSMVPSVAFFTLVVLAGGILFRDKVGELFVEKRKVEPNPELVAEYKQQIELKKQEAEKQIKVPEVKPRERPFDFLPDVMERANLCYKAIGFVMQPVAGWSQTYTKCDEGFVSATFTRNFGTLNDFYVNGAELMPGAIVQQVSENELIVRVKLPELQMRSSLDERDITSAVRDIMTAFQKINIKAEINAVTDTVSNGVDTETMNIIEIAASSKLIPSEFMKIFNDFQGVYMTSVVWNVNTRTWKYEVIVYTK